MNIRSVNLYFPFPNIFPKTTATRKISISFFSLATFTIKKQCSTVLHTLHNLLDKSYGSYFLMQVQLKVRLEQQFFISFANVHISNHDFKQSNKKSWNTQVSFWSFNQAHTAMVLDFCLFTTLPLNIHIEQPPIPLHPY